MKYIIDTELGTTNIRSGSGYYSLDELKASGLPLLTINIIKNWSELYDVHYDQDSSNKINSTLPAEYWDLLQSYENLVYRLLCDQFGTQNVELRKTPYDKFKSL